MIQTAVRIQPSDPEAHNLLGSALVAVGRNTEAIEQFRAALRSRPDYGTARYNLARALVRAGKYDEAIVDLHQIIQQFPRDARVRDELGQLYLRQGKPGQSDRTVQPGAGHRSYGYSGPPEYAREALRVKNPKRCLCQARK